jgi:hypothetical protein
MCPPDKSGGNLFKLNFYNELPLGFSPWNKIQMDLLALAKNKQSEYFLMIYKTRRCLFYYKCFTWQLKLKLKILSQ